MNNSSSLRIVSLLVAAVVGGVVSQLVGPTLQLRAETAPTAIKDYHVVETDSIKNADDFTARLNFEAKGGWKPIVAGKSGDTNYLIFMKK